MSVHSSWHWPEAKNAYAAFREAEVAWSSSLFNKKGKVYTNTALVMHKIFSWAGLQRAITITLKTRPCTLRELPVDVLIHVVAMPWYICLHQVVAGVHSDGPGDPEGSLQVPGMQFPLAYRMSMLSNNVPSRHCCIGPLSVVMLLGRQALWYCSSCCWLEQLVLYGTRQIAGSSFTIHSTHSHCTQSHTYYRNICTTHTHFYKLIKGPSLAKSKKRCLSSCCCSGSLGLCPPALLPSCSRSEFHLYPGQLHPLKGIHVVPS